MAMCISSESSLRVDVAVAVGILRDQLGQRLFERGLGVVEALELEEVLEQAPHLPLEVPTEKRTRTV